MELETNFVTHKVRNLKELNNFEKIKHVEVLEFVNFKLDKFDSVETVVNTDLSEFAKSKFENRRVHFHDVIEKNNAAGSVKYITKDIDKEGGEG